MSCSYKLNLTLWNRNAANLVFALSELPTSVFLYKEYGRRINGKSLIGILSGRFLQGDTIIILIDNPEEMSRVREIFNNFGTEVSQEVT